MPNSKEWVRDYSALPRVQAYALDRKLGRERGRMRPLLCPLVNGFIGYKPRIAPASLVLAVCMRPAFDVGFVSVGHADCKSIQFRIALWREMKHVFVTIVQEPGRVNRLEVTVGMGLCAPFDRDGLDPVDRILKPEGFTHRHCDFKRKKWVVGCIAEVQEKTPIWL